MTTSAASGSATGQHPRKTPFVICHLLSKRATVTVVLVGLAVVAGSSAIAWDGSVPEWEAAIVRFFNDWPGWLEPIFWVIQQVGVLASSVIAGLIVVWYTRVWQHLIPFFAVLPLKLGIEKGLIKQVVDRQRPYVSIGPEVTVRGPAFEGMSFPSGHMTTSMAVAILLAAFLPPRWRPVPIMWSLLVGVSRMYFGEHNFLDVVAGAALGSMFATVLWFAFLNRHVHPDCECAT